MEWYEKQYSPGDYLEHHGVLGMKWGHHKAKVAAKKERKRREKADIDYWNNRLKKSTLKQLDLHTYMKTKNMNDVKYTPVKVSNHVRKRAAKMLARDKNKTPEQVMTESFKRNQTTKERVMAVTMVALGGVATAGIAIAERRFS